MSETKKKTVEKIKSNVDGDYSTFEFYDVPRDVLEQKYIGRIFTKPNEFVQIVRNENKHLNGATDDEVLSACLVTLQGFNHTRHGKPLVQAGVVDNETVIVAFKVKGSRKPSKWGALKAYVDDAKKVLAEAGVKNASDEQISEVALDIKSDVEAKQKERAAKIAAMLKKASK